MNVLELACGTGRVTKHILSNLSSDATLVATDISEDMMTIAKRNIKASNVTWQVVDMSDIPFDEGSFDTVICQFGLMFAADKLKSLKEIRRVLKPGGQLLLNTWGNLDNNPIWQISFNLFAAYFGEMPMPKEFGPFGLPDEDHVLTMLQAAGFIITSSTKVEKTAIVESAAVAAQAFLSTSPALAKKPELGPLIQADLEKALEEKLGNHPLQSVLLALVFEAIK